ncbi:hypothetical protein CR513_28423, partial [Mucuna pruriens]
MTRSSTNSLYALDPEIEITLRRLRKARNIVVSGSSNSVSSFDNSSPVTNTSDFVEYSSTNNFAELEQMENNDRTLKELAILDMCIQYSQLESTQTYELKSGLIYLLPKFHGLTGEDPHKHLKEFHVVCSIMRPQGVLEDYIKIKVFPFSLDGATKDWLYLLPVLFNTWGDLKRIFLEKFFPASRTATIRKEIYGIRQQFGETLHEYWERFKKLCATCPHHQISEHLLIQYFYEGLSMMDRSMIDDASRGALMDKTPVVVRHLISNMASNTQQFGIRGPSQSRMVNKIGTASNLTLENQLTELTSLVRQLAIGQHQPAMAAKVCGICTFVEHPTNMCPMLQETELDQPENVGAIGGYQYGKQPYQIVWKTTISTRTESRALCNSRALCSSRIQVHTKCVSKTSKLSTTDSTISSTTIPAAATTKIATSRQFSIFGRPDEQPGVPAICELHQHAVPAEYDCHHLRPQDVDRTVSQHCEPITVGRVQQPSFSNNSKSERERKCNYVEKWKRTISTSTTSWPEKTVPVPFPTRTISARKPELDEELLKMFRKVKINIPLLDAIKKIPKYAKFLKELCVHKRKKMKGSVEVGGIVSVPCTIGECTFADAMLDLGASINVMPTPIFKALNFGDLKPTGMTIQLANKSIVQPLGVLEDVLVQVNELIFTC